MAGDLAKKFFRDRERNRKADGSLDVPCVVPFTSLSFSFTVGKETLPCSARDRKSGYTLEFRPSPKAGNVEPVLIHKELELADLGSGRE